MAETKDQKTEQPQGVELLDREERHRRERGNSAESIGQAGADKPDSDDPDHENAVTTRSDATDMGVPMLPGSPDEPVGPEDALGDTPTRGDYSGRMGETNYDPHEVRPVENAGPGEAQVEVVEQRKNVKQGKPRKGAKGGVPSA